MQEPDKRPVGRPPGPESTIINVRIPVALLARLDRYIDHVATRTGDTGVNRASMVREALRIFLDTRKY